MDTAHEIDLLLKFKRLLKDSIGKRPSNPPSSLASQIERMKGRVEEIFVELKGLEEPPHFPNVELFFDRNPLGPRLFGALVVGADFFDDAVNAVNEQVDWSIGVLKVQKSTDTKPNQAFIAMRIKNDKHEADPILQAIKAAAKYAGITAERVDEKHYTKLITDKILESIREAEYVIADLSDNRPNVYYEAGYAHASGKMMVYVADSDTDVSFDLQGYFLIRYEDAADLRSKLGKQLKGLKADNDAE